jgi:hypothetical protein
LLTSSHWSSNVVTFFFFSFFLLDLNFCFITFSSSTVLASSSSSITSSFFVFSQYRLIEYQPNSGCFWSDLWFSSLQEILQDLLSDRE